MLKMGWKLFIKDPAEAGSFSFKPMLQKNHKLACWQAFSVNTGN
jgi:hypothetical protein